MIVKGNTFFSNVHDSHEAGARVVAVAPVVQGRPGGFFGRTVAFDIGKRLLHHDCWLLTAQAGHHKAANKGFSARPLTA